MHQSHTKKRAAIAALALVPVILSPFAVLAQDSGGFTLQVVVEQSLEASSNLALSAESAGTTTQSLTQLSFHIASETHVSALSLDAAFGLRAANGPATDGTELTATDPRIALAYSQRAANASFEINADYTQSDIAYSRLSDFVDPVSGELTLPDDISDLQGTGTRQSLNFGATLRLREDAPLGVTLTASVADLSYRDTSSAELFDNRRTRLGTTVRLDINAATQARIGLHYSLFEEEATDTSRETLGLTAAVDFDRPDGSFTLGFAADDTPDGTRLSVDFGRTYTLPTGSLSASIGLTRGTDAELYATGNLQMRYTLPRGALTASLNRSVGPGSDDAEEIVTSLSLGAHNALTPVSNIGVNLAFVRAEEAAETTDITSFGVTYDYALGPDWSLSAGYGFQQRDDAGGSANASSVSLTLSRTFDFRP